MHAMKHLLILVAFAALVIQSCDVIDAPYEKNPKDPSDTLLKDTSTNIVNTGTVQNVLIEDYTGHKCVNCPAAAEVAEAIYEAHPGRVVVSSIHAGPNATANKPPAEDFLHDLNTPAGTALDETFKVSRIGNPNGLVNRVTINSRIVQGHPTWETITTQQLQRTPSVKLSMSHTYYSAVRTLVVTVRAEALTAVDAPANVSVWLQESGIIGDQEDSRKTPSHVTDYEFKHVLRASINGTWGDTLFKAPVPKGTTQTMVFRYTIPDAKLNTADTLNYWDISKMDIVAFAHKASTTKEVLQVVKQKM